MRPHNGCHSVVGTWLTGLVLTACPLAGWSGEAVPVVWAHRPYVVQMAVTNRMTEVRRVAKVATSCACLTAKVRGESDATERVPPSGVLPFELTLNPAGMEGPVVKTASVTFDDGTVETMTVRVQVKTRLALTPPDAAFGVIGPREMGRTVTAKLKGEVAERAKIVGVKGPERPFFDVAVAEDGKGVVVKMRDDGRAGARPSLHAENWIVRTDDEEIPEIAFPVSVTIAGNIAVSPHVLTVGAGEGVCSRMVMVRGAKVLSAETLPRKWGDVRIEARPLNGWRICIENVDPNEVRQFSKKPFLKIKTNVSGAESVEVPLRVEQEGGAQ